MKDSTKTEPELKIAQILFMDIVGYSKLKSNQQTKTIANLNEIVTECLPKERRLMLPTGDGMAIAFLENPESPLLTAKKIAPKAKEAKIPLRMGMHTGPVYLVEDINKQQNIVGGGINLCQRVMDCGNAGHILASKQIAESLSEVKAEYERLFHYLGKFKVKHEVEIEIYNVYDTGFGNPKPPKKSLEIERQRKAPDPERKGKLEKILEKITKWYRYLIGILVVVILIIVGVIWYGKGKLGVVFVLFDTSASTNSSEIREIYLKDFTDKILAEIQGGYSLSGAVISNNSTSQGNDLIQKDFPSFTPFKVKKDYDEQMKKNKKDILDWAKRVTGTKTNPSTMTDLMGAFEFASKIFNGEYKNTSNKILVVFSDMVETKDYNFESKRPNEIQDFWLNYFKECGAELTKDCYASRLINFKIDGKLPPPIENIIKEKKKNLPNLEGVRVWVAGAGMTGKRERDAGWVEVSQGGTEKPKGTITIPWSVIPDVVEMLSSNAIRIIRNAGFEVGTTTEYSEQPEDTVIRQNPPPGPAKPETVVHLTIAKWVEVPNVVSRTLQEARDRLTDDNLLEVSVESDDAHDNWRITRQNPQGGKVRKGTTIELWARPVVPDLLGRIREEAMRILQGIGLRGVATEVVSPNSPEGTVIAQNPSAGREVEPGSTVELTIASWDLILRGCVVNGRNGERIGGARITVEGREEFTYSDNRGNFELRLDNVPQDFNPRLKVEKEGFRPWEDYVPIDEAREIRLRPSP